jgi:hypothetical protein
VDSPFKCPAYTFQEGGKTAIMEKPLLGLDEWLEVGAMLIYNDTMECIEIAALDIVLLSSDQNQAIIYDAKMDDDYIILCKAVTKGENIESNYNIPEDVLAWKGRIYLPKDMRKR